MNKIDEIKQVLEKIDRGDYSEIGKAHENAGEWLLFLLSELDRGREENRKLREERDAYYNNARYTEAAFHEVTSLRSQLQSAQQEREKLIDALQTIRTDSECPFTSEYAKRKLKEIGVTVE